MSGVARAVQEMVDERDWGQFHSPENLAKSVVIEAAELLECFQWNGPADREAAISELADVLTYCHLLATKLDVDANIKTASRFNVRSIPMLLFFKDGKVVDQIVGAVPKMHIEQKLQQHAA